MAKQNRNAPTLDLKPEQIQVLSSDFNLFYKPQAEPEIAGVKEFTKSLDNFINNAGTTGVIVSEMKQKKENVAQAIEDYNTNKLKFRDAVKEGKIDKTANPYYLEKYKELSLNSYASEFSDYANKKYADKDVKNNITQGAFDNFYKDTLKEFIKEKNLGQFEALDLENGFFTKTSAYRQQLEAQHKSAQLKLFEEKFKEKIGDNITGIIEKWDKADLGFDLKEGDTIPDKYELMAKDMNALVQSLLEVNPDGRDVIDTVFKGLERYIENTTDYNKARKIIDRLPQLIVGGTGKVGDIGRIKNKKQQLLDALNKRGEERESTNLKFEKTTKEQDFFNTYNKLEEEKRKNPNFNITEWIDKNAQNSEQRKAGEAVIKSFQYDGGNSDNREIIFNIEQDLDDGNVLDAHTKVLEAFKSGDITSATKDRYIKERIPYAREFKNIDMFGSILIKENINALTQIIGSTTNSGDKFKAGQAKAYLIDKLSTYWRENKDKPEYKNNKYKFQKDFEKEFLEIFSNLKTAPSFNELFGKGISLTSGLTNTQFIDQEIQKAKTINDEKVANNSGIKDTNAQKLWNTQNP